MGLPSGESFARVKKVLGIKAVAVVPTQWFGSKLEIMLEEHWFTQEYEVWVVRLDEKYQAGDIGSEVLNIPSDTCKGGRIWDVFIIGMSVYIISIFRSGWSINL